MRSNWPDPHDQVFASSDCGAPPPTNPAINSKITPVVNDRLYDLEDAPQAMQDMLDPKIVGKALVVTPAFRALSNRASPSKL